MDREPSPIRGCGIDIRLSLSNQPGTATPGNRSGPAARDRNVSAFGADAKTSAQNLAGIAAA